MMWMRHSPHPEAFAGMFNTRTLANIQASWRFKGDRSTCREFPSFGTQRP